jgi:DNA-directed RNA polymerase specialized sigma24 family protein
MNTTTTKQINYDFPIRALAPRTQSRPQLRKEPARDVDDLAERMVLGDGVALDALKRRFFGQLFSIARDLIDDEGEAADLVDLVFEDASREWPPERGHVRAWLLRLMRRAARRHLALRGHDE